MAYVCLECDHEQETPGDCPDCAIALIEEKDEIGPEETGSEPVDGIPADKDEEW